MTKGSEIEFSEIQEFKPIKTMLGKDEDVDASNWSTRDVAKWLNTLELADYAPAFAEHKVTGKDWFNHKIYQEIRQFTPRLARGALQRARRCVSWRARSVAPGDRKVISRGRPEVGPSVSRNHLSIRTPLISAQAPVSDDLGSRGVPLRQGMLRLH